MSSADSGRGTRLGERVTKPPIATAEARLASMLRLGALMLAESRLEAPRPDDGLSHDGLANKASSATRLAAEAARAARAA